MRILIVAVFACGTAPPALPPSNTSTSPVIPLPSDEALGVLAFASHPKQPAVAGWIPISTYGAVIPIPNDLYEATALQAIDDRGAETRLTVGQMVPINYGCDGNQLQVVELHGETKHLHPGVLWLRPPGSSWAPKPITITREVTGEYTIGPITVMRAKDGATIAWRGRAVFQVPSDRERKDAGSPVPEAAWGIEGAVVVVLRVDGSDGVTLQGVVVNAESGRASERMSMYLYRCAF